MGFWSAIGDLAFPRWCAGCCAWDEDLCESCREEFRREWTRVDTRAPYLQRVRSWDEGTSGLLYPGDDESFFPVYALAEYDGVVRQTIVSWKNSVASGLTDVLVDLVAQRASEIELDAPVSVVPAPSSWRRRHDGRLVALHIARGLSAGLNSQATADRGSEGYQAKGYQGSAALDGEETGASGLAVVEESLTQGSFIMGLGVSRGRARLSGRGRKGREIRVRRGPSHRQVIVVDDVLTSGATLAGCARALEDDCCEVIAGFVLAAARDPRGTR